MSKTSKKLYTTADLEEIESYIRASKPEYNRRDPAFKQGTFEEAKKELNAALKWANDSAKSHKIKTIDDLFSDPLLIAKTLIRRAKPDRATILAAILYPGARPTENRMRDSERLNYIRQTFGEEVHDLVEGTLDFRALNLPERRAGISDKEWEKYCHDFRKMSKITGHDPQGRPALLRGVQLLVNLEREFDSPGTFSEAATERMVFNGNHVFAPLLYELGYSEIRTDIKNICFRLDGTLEFNRVSKVIKFSLSEDDRENIRKKAAQHIEKLGWIEGLHFEVEYRPKEAFSAHEKSLAKNIPVEKLGDLHGIRVIVKKASAGDVGESDADVMQQELIKQCRAVHLQLATAFGRYAKKQKASEVDPKFIHQQLKQLAIDEPRDLDPARVEDPAYAGWEKQHYPKFEDSCFNDYLDHPKKSGARFLKDAAIWIPIPGKDGSTRLIRVEAQIVDEDSHDNNMRGGAAHTAYKNGYFPDDSGIAEMDQVYVFDEKDRIYNVSRNPTVGGFIQAATEICENVREVRLHDPYNNTLQGGMTYGPSSPLRNGYKVAPVRQSERSDCG